MNSLLNNVNIIRKNWLLSKTWENELYQNEQKDKALIEMNSPSLEERYEAKQYGKTVLRAIDQFDQQSIDKSSNAMIAINTILALPTILSPVLGGIGGYLLSKINSTLENYTKLSIFNGAMIGVGIFLIINDYICTNIEKMTLKIARYQTRNKELKDISNFITYTKEQEYKIDEFNAKYPNKVKDNIASNMNIPKTYKDAFKTLREMKNNYKQYQEWKHNFRKHESKNKEKVDNIQFSEEELSKAQIDRNKIINSIYQLELASNNAEIDFQYALSLLQYSVKMTACAVAALLCLFISPNTSNIIKDNRKDFKLFKLSIPLMIPGVALMGGAILAQYEKDSSKLGRFEKKKELLDNETNFIKFDDKTRNEVKIPNLHLQEEEFTKTILDDIKSVKNMPERLTKMYTSKDFSKADKSIQLDISDKQKKDAEHLQKQIFYSFEKIDERSEEFSDDSEIILNAMKTGLNTAINVVYNIFALNLLTKKLKDYNGDKMPEFFEGLKLVKRLDKKDLIGIFILPYAIKSTICILLDTISTYYEKKINKVGTMTAIKELSDERVYTKEYLENIV